MKVPTTEEAVEELSFREAILPPKLRELRQKLGRKAKQQKRFRFYSLYGLVCRSDTLQAAWAAVRRNEGAPGLDGITIGQIAANPEREAAFLSEIERSLREKTYRAGKVKRVYIPKANGKLRPLGIPTVKDRVVQAAVLLILEPIFEADFEECSHGFRPGRSAHDALRAIHQNLKEGLTGVYDADLAGYFRQHSPRQAAGLCGDAGGGRRGVRTDPTVVASAGGGTALEGGRNPDGEAQRPRNAARRGLESTSGEHLSALVQTTFSNGRTDLRNGRERN